MTTLKLTKKPVNTVATGKTPIRRADPAVRDRSKAPPKPAFKVERSEEKPRAQAGERTHNESPREGRTDRVRSEGASQRNHRYDGKPREAGEHRSSQYRGAENRPGRSDYAKPQASPRPQTGVDTRTKPRANREEPQYRQAPRRGGKARDGFDATAKPLPVVEKAVAGNPDLPRLSKVMAERGLCSRREADDWITNGWVKVDGEIVDTLGTRIKPDAEIVISSYATEYQAENVTILLHKPVGYVSGQAEDGYQPAIVLIHPDNQWPEDPSLHQRNPKQFQRGYLHKLAPAGRLDIDSTGLLVLTQDGRVARQLIGEDSTVEKEYLVRVEGTLSDADLKRLNYGLSLDGVKLKPAKVSWQNEDQLRFVLREGKKRQIRRMCEMVGLHVVGLKRIRMGSVTLGKLPMGQWRYLRPDERF